MATWRLTALAAALAAALALGGEALAGAGADGGPGGRAGSFEQVLVQPMDARGRPLGPPVEIDPSAGDPASRADAAAAGYVPAGTPAARPGTRRLQASSGCRTVYVHRYRTSYFGGTLWRYTQEKYFCWTYPRLTNVQTSAYACCVDPVWRYMGTVGSSGWFYTWAGNSKGGHYSFRQGRFDQIVLGQTLSSAYPWTKIWVRADGTWSYQTDVS